MFDTNTLDWSPANDNVRSCPVCSGPIEGRDTKVYCSPQCKRRAKHQRLPRYSSAPERLCEHCNAPFNRRPAAKDAARFCSRECVALAKANTHIDRFDSENVLADELQHVPALMLHTVRHIRCVCVECGSRFSADNRNSTVCSDECRYARSYRKVVAANDNKPTVPCLECTVAFTPAYGDKRRQFCCDTCRGRYTRRITKAKKRKHLQGVTIERVDPIKVFERDGWKCQLCGVKTPRKLRGTYDKRAPELDHILPLSKGGEHSYRNTHCACRSCNAAKGATPVGQTLLFG